MKRIASALLAALSWLAPRPYDLGAALAGAFAGLVPLVVVRLAVALDKLPKATTEDLWRTSLGEIEWWFCAAAVSSLLMRLAGSGWVAVGTRVLYHLVCTVVLLLSVAELAFYKVTGSRGDFDLLKFFLEDTDQVLPVVASEVKPEHIAGLVVALLLGLAPAAIRLRREPKPLRAWVVLAALVGSVVWIEEPSRPRPAKSLRDLQASLVEHLWYDGLDRIGETTTPPSPDALVPLEVERVGAEPQPNVVVVLLESVGLKNTTLGDPALPSTPYLAELAQQGLLVEDAFAVVPHTSKALVTTLCGYWPKLSSEIREAEVGGLPNRCLPELLESVGYRTAFFQTARESFEYRGELTWRMGFDHFRARDTLRRPGFEKVNYFGIEDRAMIAPGLQWSTAAPGPFFATYLTLTSHHDYGIPKDFPPLDFGPIKGRRAEHLNAVRYVDTFVKELVDAYERAGLLENTLFVIVGDHGEAFGEHGRSQHDLVIYEEGLRIPMVVYGPGVLGGRTGVVEGPRQQIDVLPTVLEAAGARLARGSIPGVSLLSPVSEDRQLFHSCWRSHRCLATRVKDEKHIDHYREMPQQAFDLATDPTERKDRAGRLDAALLQARRAEMRDWRSRVNGLYEARHTEALEGRQAPDDGSPAVATWDGRLDLLGCTTPQREVVPGEAVWLRCRWRAREPLQMAWRLEARVATPRFKGTDVELKPFDGNFPTFRWPAGKIVEDELRVVIPTSAGPGRATVKLGWERYGNARIEVDGGKDTADAVTVKVLPRPKYDGVAVSEDTDVDADADDEKAAAKAKDD